MDCGNTSFDMEVYESTEVEIGSVGVSNDERDQALLVTDSDVGAPDEGVGETRIENSLPDEIGEPGQEQADHTAEEPAVGIAFEGEAVEDSRNDIQEAEEDNSGEGSKAPDVDCSPNDDGILKVITQGAPPPADTVSRMNTRSEVQNPNAKASFNRKSRSALRGRDRKQGKKTPSKPHSNDAQKRRIRGDSYDTKSSTTLVKNNRPSHGGDALKSIHKTCNPVRANKKEKARVKKGKTNKYKKNFKDENLKSPEGDTPGKHNGDNDGGSDGAGIEIIHRIWTPVFDFLLLMWMLLNPPADPEGYPVLDPEGYPVLDPEGYPVLDPEGYPVLDPEGYPVLDPEGYRVLDPEGYPVLDPEGYCVLDPEGYPVLDPEGYCVLDPEGYPPEKHSDRDDIEIKHYAWISTFGISNIKSILVLSMFLNPAAGAAIPPSSVSYQCCTFETLDSKISFPDVNFTIKWGEEDICTHKPYAVSLDCTKGTCCFIMNKQIVKFCNKLNIKDLFMVHGVNGATIHSTNPEELPPETVESLRILYARTSPTTSASPFPTSNYNLPVQTLETRSRVHRIAAVVAAAAVIIAIILGLLFYFGFPRCKRSRGDQSGTHI